MNKQPEHYKEGIDRVSHIVEKVFPFKWTIWEKRFYNWLYDKGIAVEDYMKEASEWGTYIHKQMELYLLGKSPRTKKQYKEFVEAGKAAIEIEKMEPIELELYLSNEFVQWTCDFYGIIRWEESIVDFKTYGLAKHKWSLHSPVYRKPTDKLKKAQLQLSIYRYLLKKPTKLYVLELEPLGYHLYELTYLWDEEIKRILFDNC